MFDWDDANLEHIARHNVEDYEIEEAFDDEQRTNVEASNSPEEKRFAILGKTEDGRILHIVYTMRQELVRVVTAREATDKQKRRYRHG